MMRTLIGNSSRAFALALTFAVTTSAAFAAGPTATVEKKKDEFQTAAPYAILVDGSSGTVLFEKGADTPNPPSSLAKLMTAELVFHKIVEGEIKLDEEFLVSEDAWRRGGAPSHTSSMF